MTTSTADECDQLLSSAAHPLPVVAMKLPFTRSTPRTIAFKTYAMRCGCTTCLPNSRNNTVGYKRVFEWVSSDQS
jgi:hypothetical protein